MFVNSFFSFGLPNFLSVSLNNDFDEKKLKKRYKELVKKYHPDINKKLLEKDSKIKEINNAYNLLTKIVKQNHEIT